MENWLVAIGSSIGGAVIGAIINGRYLSSVTKRQELDNRDYERTNEQQKTFDDFRSTVKALFHDSNNVDSEELLIELKAFARRLAVDDFREANLPMYIGQELRSFTIIIMLFESLMKSPPPLDTFQLASVTGILREFLLMIDLSLPLTYRSK